VIFGSLDFLGIHGYPNDCEDKREELPRFHGLKDSPILHITSFIDVISKLNIVHEEVKMNDVYIVLGVS
jgi:hypothetical protein